MKRVSVRQMKDLESQADQAGLSYEQMMANAGLEMAKVIHRRYFRRPTCTVLGLVGGRNNGGDTLVALRHLTEWGWQTQACLVKERDGDDPLLAAYLQAGGSSFDSTQDSNFSELFSAVSHCDLLLDGIMGTGVKLPLKGESARLLAYLKNMADLPPVVAVDCPSGVDCDNGKAAQECLAAELTVCMAAVKEGLLLQPALGLAGEVVAVDIGLPADLAAWAVADVDVMDAHSAGALLPVRPPDGHKGTFGTCLIAAGSVNYCGAVLLAARAAYRVGAGLVRAAVPGAIYEALAGSLPEAIWLILPHTLGVLNAEGGRIVRQNLERTSAMLLGPGWGLEDETLAFLKELLAENGAETRKDPFGFEVGDKRDAKTVKTVMPPLVIDADALKLLSKIDGWYEKLDERVVLTPHPGEMAALTGLSVTQIQAEREQVAREYARRWGKVVVLKGACTLVAAPDGKLTVIPVATSALAKAGTGDVLAGMLTGFVAQGMDIYSAACLAAWLHARAGVRAARAVGNPASVLADDVIEAVPGMIKQIGG